MHVDMSFSPDVSLGQIVSLLKNPSVLPELSPNVDSVKIPAGSPTAYDSTLTVKVWGLKSSYLSHCQERVTEGGQGWERFCQMDTVQLDAAKTMKYKTDSIRCLASREAAPLSCILDVHGAMKDFLFMSGTTLAVRAKHQAIQNWGRFWYLAESGGLSTKISNPLYDRSEMKADVDQLLVEASSAAKKSSASEFHFVREKVFNWR